MVRNNFQLKYKYLMKILYRKKSRNNSSIKVKNNFTLTIIRDIQSYTTKKFKLFMEIIYE